MSVDDAGWSRMTRAEAVAQASAEHGGDCLICELLGPRANPSRLLRRGEAASLVLTGLPLRPGHLLVLLHAHAESFGAVDGAAWAEASDLARRGAAALERTLEPARVYVASLGSALDHLPQTSPHLHLHVVPLARPGARPREVLTWQRGVYTAPTQVWDALAGRLRAALAAAHA